MQEEMLAEHKVSHAAEIDDAWDGPDELTKDLDHLPVLSNARLEWHRRRANVTPKKLDTDHEPVIFEPGAELTEPQMQRGARLFTMMDENNNNRVEPAEISKFFVEQFEDVKIPPELIQAVQASNDDGRLGPTHFQLFLSRFKANNGDDELDAFVAYMLLKASAELSPDEQSRGLSLFEEIDTSNNGLIERSEFLTYYNEQWPKGSFPMQLLLEEGGGHVSRESWMQFLADIKREHGHHILTQYLAGREVNAHLKKVLQERSERSESEDRTRECRTRGYEGSPWPSKSLHQSPSLSPVQSPARVPEGADLNLEEEGEEDPTSILVAMRENPELVKVVEALLVAYPSIGRNMTRRHLMAEHKALSRTHNTIIEAVLVGCKAQMASQLSGLEARDQELMMMRVNLSLGDLAVIEQRALRHIPTNGQEVSIVSSKTQVSTDGLVRPCGLHVSVYFQRCDKQWPSLMEMGTATFVVKQPDQYNWVDGTTSHDWTVEPLRASTADEIESLELDEQVAVRIASPGEVCYL